MDEVCFLFSLVSSRRTVSLLWWSVGEFVSALVASMRSVFLVCWRDYLSWSQVNALVALVGGGELFLSALEVIRQYDSCNTGELDRHAQHRQPCLASRTLRVIVRQEQPVLSGTHWSLFVHRQMSVVLCLRRFPMKQAEA